jgi:hypothetical protein
VDAVVQSRGPDWDAIERDYRAGKPLRAIAAEHGLSHTAIRKRGVRDGWQATEVSTEVSKQVSTSGNQPVETAKLETGNHDDEDEPFDEADQVAYVAVGFSANDRLAVFANADGKIVLQIDRRGWPDPGDLFITIDIASIPAITKRMRDLAREIAADVNHELEED